MVFFLLDTLKTTFSIANLTQRWAIKAFFFPKSRLFFDFREGREASPLPPSCAPSICKTVTQSSKYVWLWLHYNSIMPEYPLMCLNVPQYTWTWLNITECSWICLKMPEQTVLTIPGFSVCHNIYSYNNIIIVTDVITLLEFLSAPFIYQSPCYHFYNFLTWIRT